MLENVRNRRDDIRKAVYALIAIALPFIFLLILYSLTGNGFDLTKLFPTYSDEIGWYSQIRSYVECGEIYGNYGYNGSSAPMMGTGAWGFIILIPYILIGKIIGMTPFTMIAANIIFISIAILIFVSLVKPTKKQYFALYVSEVSLYLLMMYMSISMSESLRYAMSIFIIAFLIKLYRGEGNSLYRYVTVPLVLLLCSMIFMINVIWFPVYFFYIIRFRYPFINIAVNLFATAIIAALVNWVIGLTSCQYLQPSTMQQILSAFKEGLGNGIVTFTNHFFTNIHTVDLFQIASDAKENYGVTSWFFVLYLVVTAGFMIYAYKSFRKNNWQWILGAYIMLAFLFAFCGLYTGVRWTLARGICVGFVAAMFLLSICEKNKLYYVVSALILLSFPSFYRYSSQSFTERKPSYEVRSQIENERQELKEVMKLEKGGGRWDNTIAYYGQMDNSILAFPEGYGLNFMLNKNMVCKAKWACVGKEYDREATERLVSLIKDNGYKMFYESESFYIYQR